MSKGKNTVSTVTELAQPVADRMELLLWDVRFEKEGASWYLRLFVDRDGGVTIDECENFSRALDKILDEADPISQSYVLEVGSPGTERALTKDWHFRRSIGRLVQARYIRPVDGVKELVGELTGYRADEITLRLRESGEERRVALAQTAYVKWYDDYFMGGLDT